MRIRAENQLTGDWPRQWWRAHAKPDGVALVATLIMLSLVTFMTIAFLGVARRERRLVQASITQGEARHFAAAGEAHAQADVISRLISSDDPWNYGLIVSTNFMNSNANLGHPFPPARTDPTNVNDYALGGLWIQHLANLKFSPRVPVFDTNRFFGGWESAKGRFYLDFNRNGLFEETTGYNYFMPGSLNAYLSGDPQWIGVLDYPEYRHSRSNQFIGRYAYLVMPAGLSLDANYLHNQNKRPIPLTSEGFSRNFGAGTWEINLASFLADLNTNGSAYLAGGSWASPLNGYIYSVPLSPGPPPSSFGFAFLHARDLLIYRNSGNYNNFASPAATYGTAANPLANIGFDFYGDDTPVNQGVFLGWSANNLAQGGYHGGRNVALAPQKFNDATDFFDTNRTYNVFLNHLHSLGSATNGGSAAKLFYDQNTYYRLISQLGVDSVAPTHKWNVNFSNDFSASAESVTNFYDWPAVQFFTNVAQGFFDSSVTTNVFTNTVLTGIVPAGLYTNYFMPGLFFGAQPYPWNPVFTNIFGGPLPPIVLQFTNTRVQVNNIMLYPFNRYNPEVHRLLQLSANVYDSTRSNMFGATIGPAFPSVFRPTIGYNSTNDIVFINGYMEMVDDTWLSGDYIDLENATNRVDLTTHIDSIEVNPGIWSNSTVMVRGLPVIIGAKKFVPNFNEFASRTFVAVTRKLEFVKTNVNALPTQTNHMFIVGISNQFGVEAWNPYLSAFPRSLSLRVTNELTYVLTNEWSDVNGPLMSNTIVVSAVENLPSGTWPGLGGIGNYRTPIYTNLVLLPDSGYATNYGQTILPSGVTLRNLLLAQTNFFLGSTTNGSFFPNIVLGLTVTNWVRYALVDTSVTPNRVLDYANLTNLVGHMDLMRMLNGTTNQYNTNLFAGSFWITNRADGTTGNGQSPTIGITNQIMVSLYTNWANLASWRQWSADTPVPRRIDRFRKFMGYPGLYSSGAAIPNVTRMQAPFSPTRVAMQNLIYEANDPIVHYTTRDLTSRFASSSVAVNQYSTNAVNNSYTVLPFGSFILTNPPGSMGRLNDSFDPWGGNPNKTPDVYSFGMTIKDPGIARPDQWDFPQQRWASVGWLGRVHRGTPWQTFYMKSAAASSNYWTQHSRSSQTHPTNDWRLVHVLSAHLNEKASRGGLSVNQTNLAAWSAVLGGVVGLTNQVPSTAAEFSPFTGPVGNPFVIQPNSPQMHLIHQGIVSTHWRQTNFNRLGMILSVPQLSDGSPFLNLGAPPWYPTGNYIIGDIVHYAGQFYVANNGSFNNPPPDNNFWTWTPFLTREKMYGLTDQIVERIPQQIMGLLTHSHSPRIVVYAYGQTLKPAPRSLFLFAGEYQGMVTNYQVTGETATRTVLRIDGLPESGLIPSLRPNNEPVIFPRIVVEDFKLLESN